MLALFDCFLKQNRKLSKVENESPLLFPQQQTNLYTRFTLCVEQKWQKYDVVIGFVFFYACAFIIVLASLAICHSSFAIALKHVDTVWLF